MTTRCLSRLEREALALLIDKRNEVTLVPGFYILASSQSRAATMLKGPRNPKAHLQGLGDLLIRYLD